MIQEVILVNEADIPIGAMEKLEAHQKARLHRAFSVFVFNTRGDLLLQQRADNKYHSPGLWTNTCCSHPNPGEDTEAAAQRRLGEEMGFQTRLVKAFDFIYQAPFDNGLTEHEFDHVFVGRHDGEILPNKEEVKDYCYQSPTEIESAMESHPQKYTVWFHIAFPKLMEWCKTQKEYHVQS